MKSLKTALFASILSLATLAQADGLQPVMILAPTPSLDANGTSSHAPVQSCVIRIQGFNRDEALGFQKLRFELLVGTQQLYTLDVYMRGDIKNLDLAKSYLVLPPEVQGKVSYAEGVLTAEAIGAAANAYPVKTWKIQAASDLSSIKRIEFSGASNDFACEF